jgi:hypothetical protein
VAIGRLPAYIVTMEIEEVAMAAPADMAASEGGGDVDGSERQMRSEAAQQALLDDIDAILARIDVRLAEQNASMDALLDRIKRKVP